MLLYMSNTAFHLAGDGKVCVCVCEYVCVCVCVCVCVWVLCIFSVVMYSMVCKMPAANCLCKRKNFPVCALLSLTSVHTHSPYYVYP